MDKPGTPKLQGHALEAWTDGHARHRLIPETNIMQKLTLPQAQAIIAAALAHSLNRMTKRRLALAARVPPR